MNPLTFPYCLCIFPYICVCNLQTTCVSLRRSHIIFYYYYYTRVHKCVEKIRTKQPETFIFKSPFSPAVRLSIRKHRFRVHFVRKPVSGSVERYFRRSTDVPSARGGHRALKRTSRPDHHRRLESKVVCVCVVVNGGRWGYVPILLSRFSFEGKKPLCLRRVTD